jgi:hypothetical protein
MKWTGARYADKPTVEVSVWINATPQRVWELVSDIELMPTMSEELQSVAWLDGVTEPSVGAEFYRETLAVLGSLGIESHNFARPNEVDPAIPFAEDVAHAAYDPEAARTFWQQLVQAHRVIGDFRAGFVGKVSPVHFFWGAMDLACTRFSGRPAPRHPGGAPNCPDWVMVEGYSRELSSCGFWPGGGREGAFYSYAYPEPSGFARYPIAPDGAYFSEDFGEFLLPYEAARAADDPDHAVARFLQTTYEAAAELGGWDRAALEDDPHRLPPRSEG